MNLNLKQLMDLDTVKVIGAASINLGAAVVGIDWAFKTIISMLTIWYLWRKIHQQAEPGTNKTEEDDDL